MKKRVLAFLLCLCLCGSLLPAAFASGGPNNPYTVTLHFTYSDGASSGGAIRVRNADGTTTDYTDGDVVSMAGGETCRFTILPLADGTSGEMTSASGARPGEETIDGVTYITFSDQDSHVYITYGANQNADGNTGGTGSLSGITLNFAQFTGILPGASLGAGTLGDHFVTALVDGTAVTNFTVISADTSVCTVKNENGTIVVTNVGYGESKLTITVGGVSEEFNWVCRNDDSGSSGSGDMGPVVSEDDYTVDLTIQYAEGYTGPQTGGIQVYDMEGKAAETITESRVITVPGGSKFYYTVLSVDGVNVGFSGSGDSGMEIVNGQTLYACYNDNVLTFTYGVSSGDASGEPTTDGITLNFAQFTGILPGMNLGAGTLGDHFVTVLVDGTAVTNFTVTSADTSVCTVKIENGVIVVTNVGYGESKLTITVDGVSEEFNWVCRNDDSDASDVEVSIPPNDLPTTGAALNGEDVSVKDVSSDGSGNALEISSTVNGETVTVIVHTDSQSAVQDAVGDENASLGVNLGSGHMDESSLPEKDKAALDELKKDQGPGKACGAVKYLDVFADLVVIRPEGESVLGSVKELPEEAEFTMEIKKSALNAMGRDIEHLYIVRVHDGKAEKIWVCGRDGDRWEDTGDGYRIHFRSDRFSTYALMYDRVIGDIDGDDRPLEVEDLISMLKYVLGAGEPVVQGSVDVTGDGQEDILDVLRLMRKLSGEDVELS